MSITSRANIILTLIRAIRTSLINKTVPITATTPYAEWPALVDEMQPKSAENIDGRAEYTGVATSEIAAHTPAIYKIKGGLLSGGYISESGLITPTDTSATTAQISCAVSGDGTLLAYTSKTGTAYGVFVYKKITEGSFAGEWVLFQQIPSSVFSGSNHTYQSIRFGLNKTYLVVSFTITPGVVVLKADAETGLYSRIDVTTASSTGYELAFSPDGNHLASSHSAAPFFRIYNRTDDVFTLQALTATARPTVISFSPDSNYLVRYRTTTITDIYKRTGGVFGTLTTLAGRVLDCAWSPDGNYLAVLILASPYIQVYSRTSDTFTNIATLNAGLTEGFSKIRFGTTSQYIFIFGYSGANGRPETRVLDFNGTEIVNTYFLVGYGTQTNDVAVLPDGSQIVVSYGVEQPYVIDLVEKREIIPITNNLGDIYGHPAFGYAEDAINSNASGQMQTITRL